MTNQEILTKAIQKAIEGGWKGAYPHHSDVDILAIGNGTNNSEAIKIWFLAHTGDTSWDVQKVIYSCDFAQALWPDKPSFMLECSKCEASYNWWDDDETVKYGFPPAKYCNHDGTKLKKVIENKKGNSPWWGHLRNMVVSDDAIKYLGDHI